MAKRIILWTLGAIVALIAGFYLAAQFSPWPAALVIRYFFDQGGVALNNGLEKHVPPGIAGQRDLAYGTGPDEVFDVYYPEGTAAPLPTIVWVHGGGWVSGSKNQIANYLRILAGHGYTTVGINYSIAPDATYPTPLHQLDAALAHLIGNAAQYNIDTGAIVLAGDSAGAQIAAQMAAIVTIPSYAEMVGIVPSLSPAQLRAALLFCGAYDVALADPGGGMGWFINAVLWAYSGTRDFRTDPRYAQFSVANYVTGDFPPAFITGGNADPLTPHSVELAQRLDAEGVAVDTLFYAEDYSPGVPHVYQFNLDIDAGRLALERTIAFLRQHTGE